MLDQVTESYNTVTTLHYAVRELNTIGVSWLVTLSLVTVIGGSYFLYSFVNKLNSHHSELTKEVKNIGRGLDKISVELRSQQVEILDRQSREISRMDRFEQDIKRIKVRDKKYK